MSFKTSTAERLLLVAMVGLSAVLAALQYRWTNDLSRAERSVNAGIIKNQMESLCRVFDQQLSANCLALVPEGNDVAKVGFEAANLNRFASWQAGPHRPLFARIGVVLPLGDGLKVFLLDQKSRQLRLSDPPENWSALLENLALRQTDRPAPFDDPAGTLYEYPVFQPGEGKGSAESQWTVTELDLDYLRNVWLPELFHQFLGPDLGDIEVTTAHGPAQTIFSSGARHPDQEPVRIPFNRQGHSEVGPVGIKSPVWTLTLWPNTTKLEQAEARSRGQSFFLAVFLDGLILCAVVMLMRHARHARELAEAQMNFVAATSHELRTPLTVIRGAAHNLERGIVTDPKRIGDYARMITRNSEQLTRMVEQVLAFSNAQRTDLRLNLRSVNLGAVLEKAAAPLRDELAVANVSLEISDSTASFVVFGDEESLVRVFQNLISNALKHGGEGGWIGIEALDLVAEKTIEIHVTDSGPGIAKGESEKIFEPFYRSATTIQKQTRGSGIGLSLVRQIIRAHHGTIVAGNRPQGGAEFIVLLPLPASKKS